METDLRQFKRVYFTEDEFNMLLIEAVRLHLLGSRDKPHQAIRRLVVQTFQSKGTGNDLLPKTP